MERRREYLGYVVGTAGTVVTALFLGLRGESGGQVHSLFLPAVLASAYIGGWRPGLATIGLVTVAAFYVSAPLWQFAMTEPRDQERLLSLVLVALVMLAIITALHRARERAETSLQSALASEARFEQLFQTSPVPKSLSRISDRKVIEVNEAYLQTFGVTRDEIVGRSPADAGIIVNEESRDAMSEELRATGEIRDLEVKLHGRHGGERSLLLSSQVIDVGGEDMALSLFVDLTQHRRAVARADESDALLRQLAESLHQVFWMTDPDNNVLYVSSQFENVWGLSAVALMRDSGVWVSSIHPDDRARIVTALSSLALGGYSQRYRIVRPCGTVRWIHDKAFPIRDAHGAVVRVAGVAEDITEQVQLEEKLRQTQKLESIGLLAGGVAHDFNNILCVIAANTELLREDLSKGHQCSELVDEIEGSVDRAKALTKQLLVFGRKDVTQRVALDLNATLDEGRTMLRRVIGEEYALRVSLDPDVGPVLADPNQLTQVLTNLCVNARDAMVGGGTITIETRSYGAKATISVTDTGTGMTPETVARLYEPFFTTKEVGRGTGLGLPVVHGIVQEMRGTIDVETELGRGSTFTITLPTIQSAPCSRPDRRRDEAKGTERILLVDDDEQLRLATTRALQRRGYSVIEASNGREALALLGRGERVDLLVTDVVMPVMDGRSLAEQATRQRPALRVLYISGYTDDEVIRRGIEHAKAAFIPKPFGPSVLAARVREMLDAPATA